MENGLYYVRGISTQEKLPSLESEANWSKHMEILPLYNFQVALPFNEGNFSGNEMSMIQWKAAVLRCRRVHQKAVTKTFLTQFQVVLG